MKSNKNKLLLFVLPGAALLSVVWLAGRIFHSTPIPAAASGSNLQRLVEKKQAAMAKAVCAVPQKPRKIILVRRPAVMVAGELQETMEEMPTFLSAMADQGVEVVAKLFYPEFSEKDRGRPGAGAGNPPAAWLASAAANNPGADMIVSFSGLPEFSAEEPMANFKGRLPVLVCLGSGEKEMAALPELMRAGIILAAVMPRGGQPPKELNERNFFDAIYATVTPENLDDWIKKQGAK